MFRPPRIVMIDIEHVPGQWSKERATAWADERPWHCGFNFLPSTAVNFLEMWHPDTFDAETIERELGWAADIGLNTVRTNIHFLVWQNDRDRLLERIDEFLGIARRRGMTTVLCLLDDCGFGDIEPVYGPQPDPLHGIHNSRAVASPGRSEVMDRTVWPELQRYVGDVISAFGKDERVLLWDLYNEPGNGLIFAPSFGDVGEELEPHSRELMHRCFEWARAVEPVQPLSVGAWRHSLQRSAEASFETAIDQDALHLSDVLNFHAYLPSDRVQRILQSLLPRGRPVFCTEWMARAVASRITDQLELMRRHGVGCYHWGLVRGRTQTHLPWPAELLALIGHRHDGRTWFHDLLEPDGTPHDTNEIEMLRAARARADAIEQGRS